MAVLAIYHCEIHTNAERERERGDRLTRSIADH